MHVVCVAGFMHSVMFAQCFLDEVNLFKLCPLKLLKAKEVQHGHKRVECIFT